jgi:hypothetical protein
MAADADSERRALREALEVEAEAMAQFDWIGHPNLKPLARELDAYDRQATVATISGLLTVPAYQSASLRLELLLHLAVCRCNGTRRITKRALARWVNETLAALPIRRMEDPVEDVFVSNVVAGGGNYRLFEGTWEGNDYHLQLLLDLVYLAPAWKGEWRLRAHIEGLLALSDAIASRAKLKRWTTTVQEFPRSDVLRRLPDLGALQRRVSFSEGDLGALRIIPEQLALFMANPSVANELPSQAVRRSVFLRRPLARFDGVIVVLLPSAISMAIRHAILDVAAKNELIPQLQHDFDQHQAEMLFGRMLGRLDLPSGYASPNAVTPPSGMQVPSSVAGVAFVPFDVDKVAHVVLLTDDLADVHRTGVAADVEIADATEQDLVAYLVSGAHMIGRVGATGMTLLVLGGLGRGMSLSLPRGDGGLPADWPIMSFSLSDLQAFAVTEGASLLRLWKLDRQETAAREAGIAVANQNGALNLYAFWEHQGFELVSSEMPVPQAHGLMMIQADFLYQLRVATRRLTDVHSVRLGGSGAQLRVRRLHERPFFESSADRPIYAADDLLAAGELAGVVESEDLVVWIFAGRPHAPAARDTLYRTWDAILSWLDRLFPFLLELVADQREITTERSTQRVDHEWAFVRQYRLQLEDEGGWASDSIPATSAPAARPWVTPADDAGAGMVIHVPVGFQTLLNQPANAGERALLEEVALDVVASWIQAAPAGRAVERDVLSAAVTDAVAACMGGSDAREMHVWHTTRPLDQIDASGLGAPRFVQPEDAVAWQLGLGTRLGVKADAESDRGPAAADQPRGAVVVEGASESVNLLHRLVDHVWGELQSRLQELDGAALIEMLVRNVEAVFKDRDQWRRTARAVAALNASEDVPAISMRRESERAVTGTASRVVMEMAICASRTAGGRRPSISDMDWLVAGVALLLDAAADADAIRGGLGTPRVVVALNGRVRTDRDELEAIVRRYGRDTHADEFRAAADAYDDLFRRGVDDDIAAGIADTGQNEPAAKWDERFRLAYEAEFGISFDRMIDAFAELIDLAGEKGRVVVTTRGAMAERLRATRGFSVAEVEAFFSTVSLEPRARWDETPAGFTKRDWEPWRFRRRLSVSARPIIVFGHSSEATCIYGVAQLGASLSYVPEGIRSGWFPLEYFRSAEMRQYRGTVADELGTEFEHEIAGLCSDAGWSTRRSVKMSALGAPARLGDIDVLAWRPDDQVLWLIECKRLQPTRTISEIVERLRQFRGESNDLLAKHMRRVQWVRGHLDAVRAKLELPDGVGVVHPILVTNTRMPMQYAQGLPLSPEHVVSEEHLLPLLERARVSRRTTDGR